MKRKGNDGVSFSPAPSYAIFYSLSIPAAHHIEKDSVSALAIPQETIPGSLARRFAKANISCLPVVLLLASKKTV